MNDPPFHLSCLMSHPLVLVRILVKLFPQAPLNTSSTSDMDGGTAAAGGGNRLSGIISNHSILNSLMDFNPLANDCRETDP